MENATVLLDNSSVCFPAALHHYSAGELAFVTISLLFIVCGTVFGNILVFLSLLLVKKLRTPSNLLLLSLSVSDLSIALTVEPFALYKTVNVQWEISRALCQIYLFLDVMLCTASILNLNVITIDRYLVITRPFQYSVRRTPRLMAVFIACVWLLAIAISSAAFAWPQADQADAAPDCYYTQALSYQMYATVAAFYLPLAAMLTLWARIFLIARRMASADRAQQCRVQQNASACHSPGHFELRVTGNSHLFNHSDSSLTNKVNQCVNNNHNNTLSPATCRSHTLLPTVVASEAQCDLQCRRSSYPGLLSRRPDSDPASPPVCSPLHSRLALGSDEQLADDCVGQNGFARKWLGPTALSPSTAQRARTSTTVSLLSNATAAAAAAAASKRKASSGENKALVTIATIMTCFTLCWLPFFLFAFINPIYALLVGCDIDIGHHGRTLLLWLGYANSFMNPLIYCKFNRDFRRPFIEFLKCHCRDVNARLRVEQYVEQYGVGPNSSPSIHQVGAVSVTLGSPTGRGAGAGIGSLSLDDKARKRKLLASHLTRRQAEEAGLLTPCTKRSKIPKEHILIANRCVPQVQVDDGHKQLFARVSCASEVDNPLVVAIE